MADWWSWSSFLSGVVIYLFGYWSGRRDGRPRRSRNRGA